MKLIRKILVKILGLKGYLKLVSRVYIWSVSRGFFKSKYPELFFLERIIKPGDTILDIGANLGYYSNFMSKFSGPKGKVYGVEPIPLFAEIWEKNMRHRKENNFKLLNVALGSEEKEKVQMSIPIVNGVVRHGLTKVNDSDENTDAVAMRFEVPMKKGDDLMTNLNIQQLQFIKCDVEGYEQFVLPSLKNTITTFKPLIQIELSGDENRKNVYDFLTGLGYASYILKSNHLADIQKNDIFSVNQDFYFLHPDRLESYRHLFNSK